jgi:ABC-type transport system involved in multi-copper enzyme maturation permease subunit
MSAAAETVGGALTRPAPRLSFFGTVGAEARKVRGQRSTLAILGGGVLLWVGVMLLLSLSGRGSPETLMRHTPAALVATWRDILYTVFTMGSGIVLLLTTARLVGMEYSLGTIRILLARGTGRVSLLLAKLVVMAALGVVMLAAFAAASAVWVGADALRWTGSLNALRTLPVSTLHDLELGLLMSLMSMGCAILIGSAAATLGRSVAFGVGVALGLFPADNFGTTILGLLTLLTKQQFWSQVTAYLLGPNLNALPSHWITGRKVATALTPPLVRIDLTHALVVVAAWALALFLLQVILTWRRDVLA